MLSDRVVWKEVKNLPVVFSPCLFCDTLFASTCLFICSVCVCAHVSLCVCFCGFVYNKSNRGSSVKGTEGPFLFKAEDWDVFLGWKECNVVVKGLAIWPGIGDQLPRSETELGLDPYLSSHFFEVGSMNIDQHASVGCFLISVLGVKPAATAGGVKAHFWLASYPGKQIKVKSNIKYPWLQGVSCLVVLCLNFPLLLARNASLVKRPCRKFRYKIERENYRNGRGSISWIGLVAILGRV